MTYKSKSKLITLLVVLLLCIGCKENKYSKMVFPDEEWQIASPESQEIDSKLMNKALEYLKNNIRHDGIKQMMIIRNGYMIFGGDDIDFTGSRYVAFCKDCNRRNQQRRGHQNA